MEGQVRPIAKQITPKDEGENSVTINLIFLKEFTLFSMSVGVIRIFCTAASRKQVLSLLGQAFAFAKKSHLMKAVTETTLPHCKLCTESTEYVAMQKKLWLGGIFSIFSTVCQQNCWLPC